MEQEITGTLMRDKRTSAINELLTFCVSTVVLKIINRNARVTIYDERTDRSKVR